MTGRIVKTEVGTVYEGSATRIFQAAVVKTGLKLAQKGLRVNAHITPTMLMAKAAEITGKKYKRRDYVKAIDDLDAWIKEAAKSLDSAPDPIVIPIEIPYKLDME